MPTQPSVFMIGWEYPPHNSGGLGVACEGMTQALAQAGHHIAFTLPYDFHGQVDHMQMLSCVDPRWQMSAGQPPFSVYSGSLHSTTALSLNPDELKSVPQSELEARVEQYADKVVQRSVQQDLDVIHAHDWLSFPAAIALKEETGKPFIAHVHSTELDRIPNGNGSNYIRDMEALGMQAADMVIAVSFYTRQILIKKYGIDPRKIAVVHNGILPSQDSIVPKETFAGDRPVIVFMGRLTEQKGGVYFLSLAKKVLQTMPNALFVIAGHGDMYQELLLTAAGKELSAHVMFSGFLRDTQKNKLLSRADAFIMPSLSEPFGLVALEAAQHNTPVIVSKNSGVAEVMPSAIAVDFWDVDLMSEKLVSLLKNKKAQQSQIAKQHRNLASLTWENSAKKIQDVYKRAFLGL